LQPRGWHHDVHAPFWNIKIISHSFCQEQNKNIHVKSQVSVVIPVLNAAATLPGCLQTLAGAAEIIVVDGGSTDASVAIAEAHGARILHAAPSRGGQLRAGIAVARAPYLLLLHADTVPPPGWADTLSETKAGYFRLRYASSRRATRLLEFLAALRCRVFALPYGDQGMLLSAALLAQVGGVPDLPLMEDVALARRLGRSRLQALPGCALTSAARYERDGFLRRPLRNACCLAGYFAGIPVATLKRLYG
jgi:rSAM/selenodomain-associated transferase 2